MKALVNCTLHNLNCIIDSIDYSSYILIFSRNVIYLKESDLFLVPDDVFVKWKTLFTDLSKEKLLLSLDKLKFLDTTSF